MAASPSPEGCDVTTHTIPRHRFGATTRTAGGSAQWLPAVMLLAIWAGAAGVLGLWWSNTASVSGLDQWLTGAGRITGLLAGYASAILLLLMARAPLIDRSVGTDRLAHWHAMGGRYTVSLTAVHALLIILGYSVTTHTGVVDQTVSVVIDYPEMLSGTAGFGLFIATGVISARAARRKLSYETWHYLHLAAYLSVYLAFGHQLANGADFIDNPTARYAWYALYLGVAGILVWYRFLTPVIRNLRHRPRVHSVREETPGVVSVYVTGERLAELRVRPGQFFRWRFLTPGLWWSANPYSLSAPPDPRYLRITVRAAGTHSAALAHLKPGTRVWLEGPYGGLTADRGSATRTLLVAGGVGITPLRTLFETLPGRVTLIYRARHAGDLALRTELDAIAAARGARVHYSVDVPNHAGAPLTAHWLNRVVPGLSHHDVYICGPTGMTEAAISALRDAGVPRRRIHHESFSF